VVSCVGGYSLEYQRCAGVTHMTGICIQDSQAVRGRIKWRDGPHSARGPCVWHLWSTGKRSPPSNAYSRIVSAGYTSEVRHRCGCFHNHENHFKGLCLTLWREGVDNERFKARPTAPLKPATLHENAPRSVLLVSLSRASKAWRRNQTPLTRRVKI